MKNILKVSICAFLMAFITPLKMNAQAANVTQTVKIKTSAECDMCKSRIEKEVRAMKGVKSADLDLTTKILTVEYNPKKISPENIRTAISNIGYDADDVKANNRSQKELPKCCHPPKN